jgi:hypothetical protein
LDHVRIFQQFAESMEADGQRFMTRLSGLLWPEHIHQSVLRNAPFAERNYGLEQGQNFPRRFRENKRECPSTSIRNFPSV